MGCQYVASGGDGVISVTANVAPAPMHRSLIQSIIFNALHIYCLMSHAIFCESLADNWDAQHNGHFRHCVFEPWCLCVSSYLNLMM